MHNRYYANGPKTVYYDPQRWIDYLWQRGITYHPLPPAPDMGQSPRVQPQGWYGHIKINQR